MAYDFKLLAQRFLTWPLPNSVASDFCVTNRTYPFPRSGTNLLSADEAEQMLRHVLDESSQTSEFDDVDRLLIAFGLRPSAYRSEDGHLLVGKIQSALAEQMRQAMTLESTALIAKYEQNKGIPNGLGLVHDLWAAAQINTSDDSVTAALGRMSALLALVEAAPKDHSSKTLDERTLLLLGEAHYHLKEHASDYQHPGQHDLIKSIHEHTQTLKDAAKETPEPKTVSFEATIATYVESCGTKYMVRVGRKDRQPKDSFDDSGTMTVLVTEKREDAETDRAAWDAFLNGAHVTCHMDFVQALVDTLREMKQPPTVDHRWVIAKETASDAGTERKVLTYALLPNSDTWSSSQQAIKAIQVSKLPSGWVALPLRRIFPHGIATVQGDEQWQVRTYDGTEWTDWVNCTSVLVERHRKTPDFEFRCLREVKRFKARD